MADDSERVREDDENPDIHSTHAVASSLETADAPTDVSPDPPTRASSQDTLTRHTRQPVNKTPDAVAVEFLALIEEGCTPREASTKVGIHLRTGQRLLSRHDADLEAIQAATRQIMALEALDRVDDWRTAAAVGASKRGNHLPAKDWLLHAGVIDPLQGEQQAGIRIAIHIGTEERPLRIPSPLTQTDEE